MIFLIILGAILLFVTVNLKDINYLSLILDYAPKKETNIQIFYGRLLGGAVILGSAFLLANLKRDYSYEIWVFLTVLILIFFAFFEGLGKSAIETREEVLSFYKELESTRPNQVVFLVARHMIYRGLERFVVYFSFMHLLSLEQSFLVLFILELAVGGLVLLLDWRKKRGKRIFISMYFTRVLLPLVFVSLALLLMNFYNIQPVIKGMVFGN
ncbi:MAG: hypothetical protein VB108_02365 [Anaerolineaceae bacterium]|nr:hypothetical protein [Anaerolineaceae bacterium]